jgi:hypothetical protein
MLKGVRHAASLRRHCRALRRLFAADSLRSNNAQSPRAVDALRRPPPTRSVTFSADVTEIHLWRGKASRRRDEPGGREETNSREEAPLAKKPAATTDTVATTGLSPNAVTGAARSP